MSREPSTPKPTPRSRGRYDVATLDAMRYMLTPRPGATIGFLLAAGLATGPGGLASTMPSGPATARDAERELIELIRADRPYATVPNELFEKLGWPLPDGLPEHQ